MRQQLLQLKTQEETIRKGLNIFKIDQPPSHVIVTLEKVHTVLNIWLICDVHLALTTHY